MTTIDRYKPCEAHRAIQAFMRQQLNEPGYVIGESTLRRYRSLAFIPRKRRYTTDDLYKWSFFTLAMHREQDVAIAQDDLLEELARLREQNQTEKKDDDYGDEEQDPLFRTVNAAVQTVA